LKECKSDLEKGDRHCLTNQIKLKVQGLRLEATRYNLRVAVFSRNKGWGLKNKALGKSVKVRG